MKQLLCTVYPVCEVSFFWRLLLYKWCCNFLSTDSDGLGLAGVAGKLAAGGLHAG